MHYITIGRDYMTQWEKAIETNSNFPKDVAKFIFENISFRFGTPLEIFLDR